MPLAESLHLGTSFKPVYQQGSFLQTCRMLMLSGKFKHRRSCVESWRLRIIKGSSAALFFERNMRFSISVGTEMCWTRCRALDLMKALYRLCPEDQEAVLK